MRRSISAAVLAVVLLIPRVAPAAESRIVVSKMAPDSSRLRVSAERASLRALIASIELHLNERVIVELPADRRVTYRAAGVTPESALKAIVARNGLVLSRRDRAWVVRDPKEPTVTLDVTDEPIASILKNVQKQCGIRNLMVDPDVTGKGTFLFNQVPCGDAMRAIFSSLGLDWESYPSSVVRVGTPK